MARIGLRIEPLDTLFFRDGRPFDGQPRAMSGLPQPQTLAGALRTWLLREAECDFGALAAAVKRSWSFEDALRKQSVDMAAVARLTFRGPWLCRGDGPLIPVPAILRRIKGDGSIVRLAPLQADLPGWQPPAPGMRPLWWRGREPTETLEGYLTFKGLRALVEGRAPAADDIVPALDLYGFDRRTGIVVAETRTAAEGAIYSVSLLALKNGVSFYAEIEGDTAFVPQHPATLPFGGEGRRVLVERTDPCNWPSAPAEDGRAMLVLTSPGLFDGWRPPGLDSLRAAAMPGHAAVSGWDLARGGPKPNRFAVAAGSVYFLARAPADPPIARSLCDGEDGAVAGGPMCRGRGTMPDPKTKETALLFIHALTGLHPGSGTALGHVDLPVARERHTGWPLIPASTLKGVLRDACRPKATQGEDYDRWCAVFGPETANAAEHAGALSLTDARILAFPVRSLVGVFAWVTCPAVLQRLNRDLGLVNGGSRPFDVPLLQDKQAACPDGSPLLIDGTPSLVLEEFDFERRADVDVRQIAEWIAGAVRDDSTAERIKKHLVVVADEAFGHFVRHATEVTARIGLRYETKTVKDGALFYEEFLPPETLFYSLVFAEPSRRASVSMTAAGVIGHVSDNLPPPPLQMGADETIGKGLCAVHLHRVPA